MNSGVLTGTTGRALTPDEINSAPARTREKISALILDDCNFDRRRLMRDCRKAGLDIEFTEVSTITGMSRALDSRTFDIVFVDYRLTDGSGLGALETIYGHPSHGDCATIMISGDGDADIGARAVRMGCNDYIEKARINPDSICDAVIAAVRKSRLQRESVKSPGPSHAVKEGSDGLDEDRLREMEPILRRMMRQVRRQHRSPDGTTSAELREDFEASCRELWDFFLTLEDSTAEPAARTTSDSGVVSSGTTTTPDA